MSGVLRRHWGAGAQEQSIRDETLASVRGGDGPCTRIVPPEKPSVSGLEWHELMKLEGGMATCPATVQQCCACHASSRDSPARGVSILCFLLAPCQDVAWWKLLPARAGRPSKIVIVYKPILNLCGNHGEVFKMFPLLSIESFGQLYLRSKEFRDIGEASLGRLPAAPELLPASAESKERVKVSLTSMVGYSLQSGRLQMTIFFRGQTNPNDRAIAAMSGFRLKSSLRCIS